MKISVRISYLQIKTSGIVFLKNICFFCFFLLFWFYVSLLLPFGSSVNCISISFLEVSRKLVNQIGKLSNDRHFALFFILFLKLKKVNHHLLVSFNHVRVTWSATVSMNESTTCISSFHNILRWELVIFNCQLVGLDARHGTKNNVFWILCKSWRNILSIQSH